jgi:hypothetical protein
VVVVVVVVVELTSPHLTSPQAEKYQSNIAPMLKLPLYQVHASNRR